MDLSDETIIAATDGEVLKISEKIIVQNIKAYVELAK